MTVPMQFHEERVYWITATVMLHKVDGHDQMERALKIGEDIIMSERTKHNDVRRSKFLTFDGLTCGGAFVGQSGQGLAIRLSGDAARDHWRSAAKVATNITRLDVAATYKLTEEWRDMSRLHHDEASRYQREHSPRTRVTRIDGGKHGRSLTIGSRSSDAYGRIYDKGAESGLEEWRDCWRYEVEFKRSQAVQAAELLGVGGVDGTRPAELASSWFARRLVRLPEVHLVDGMPAAPLQVSDDQRRLRWLRRGVARSVRTLVEHGHRAEVLKVLGL